MRTCKTQHKRLLIKQIINFYIVYTCIPLIAINTKANMYKVEQKEKSEIFS